ncbi:MAG TPA: ribonuclease P protein component [Bdellovibrionota bacterium]|nr:ribonuclease P protein component [Bdellovibrionota bacterium]
MYLADDVVKDENKLSPRFQKNKFNRKDKMLRKKQDFQHLLEDGEKQVSKNFIFFKRKGSGQLGIIVSRKVGGAVIRNRVRRLVFESYRLKQKDFLKLDVVVVARKWAREVKLKNCFNEWQVCYGSSENIK